MADGPLWQRLKLAPAPDRDARAAARLSELLEGVPPDHDLRRLLAHQDVAGLLAVVAAHSPFLWQLIVRRPERCARILSTSPEQTVADEIGSLSDRAWDAGLDGSDLMTALRRARQAIALVVALADLGRVWSLEQVTDALTRFADAAVRVGVQALIREAVRAGRLLPDTDLERDCGVVVLALGKQGAAELNYSSDIDLVVLFDPSAARLPDGAEPARFYVRLTQQLVRLMQERTADGYVLRMDLRLRPDPASTAVAISILSAFAYYENHGQNWERAAFIKARPVAGDLGLGERFLAELTPFIWRKYFDYAAIADIHAMKRQIHAVRGQAEVAVAGHNVKLGRGGIREVEFFVQTQQLIFGGRRPQLRGRRTLAMLNALEQDGWIGAAAVEDLTEAYRFLRTIEHRLQMVADEQTQKLPETAEGLESFARFAGFADADAFADALTGHLRRVESHYARLFEDAPGLDSDAGSLVFTGTAADPETLETLRAMGFTRPDAAVEIIRGWHFGRRAAVQTMRAREVVTELTPALLQAFAGSSDPDAALATMDTMLARMPAAIELLSLLRSNAGLRELFADLLGSAPRLASVIGGRPHLLDVAIDPAALQGGDDVAVRLGRALRDVASTEDFLDRAREFTQEEIFAIGVRLLSGALDPDRAGEAFSRLADLIVQAALDRCMRDFTVEHGQVAGGACVVLGMGKLGSREMTATSDLDLIVIYRFDADAGPTDAPRPLDGVRYYTRLTQRLIAALTAPTRRGHLYDVDVRLRPSGRQGPLATQFRSFVSYQANEAQTWEHMALSRARVVAGDPALAADVEGEIRRVLSTAARDGGVLRADIRTMRALVAKEKGETDLWDFKLVAGGLLDLEFLAQYLVLRHAPAHPSLLLQAPLAVIEEARRLHLIEAKDAEVLSEAYRSHTALAQLTRLTVAGRFDPAKAGVGVLRRLCAVVNVPDVSALASTLVEQRSSVREILRRHLDWSAE